MSSIVTHLRIGAALGVVVVLATTATVHAQFAAAAQARAESIGVTLESLRHARLAQSALADALVAAREPTIPIAIRSAIGRAHADLRAIEPRARTSEIAGLLAALEEQIRSASIELDQIALYVHASAALTDALDRAAWRDTRRVTGAQDAVRRSIWVGAALLLVLAALLWFLAERKIGGRLRRLADSADALAEGNLVAAVTVAGDDEIAALAEPLERLRQMVLEVESTAYAAAHDMKSPVFAIRELLEWTLEDHGATIPAEARENIERALERCLGLAALQDDLLLYAVAIREDEACGVVDIAAVVRDAHDATAGAMPFDLHLTCEDAVDARLPPLATRRIISNLVSNVVRHHDRDHGRIAVVAWRIDGRIHLEVADDGPGIDPADHERLQLLFERDRGAGGSGLGLALVRKLAERFGGELRIRSPLVNGRGTAIIVTLAEGPTA